MKRSKRFAAFCLPMGTSPIDFALLGGNKNTLNKEKPRTKRPTNIDHAVETYCEYLPPCHLPFFLIKDYLLGPTQGLSKVLLSAHFNLA